MTLNRIALDMRRDSEQRQRQRAAKVVPRVTLVTSIVLLPGALAVLDGRLRPRAPSIDFGQFWEIAAP